MYVVIVDNQVVYSSEDRRAVGNMVIVLQAENVNARMSFFNGYKYYKEEVV